MRMLLILTAVLGLCGFAQSDRYAAGQVWEYRTRPGDEGSLLKIQRIDADPAGKPIYHISIIRFRLRNPEMTPELNHAPVSRETLDASVTKPGDPSAAFPDADPGIAVWKADNGGVFTIPVAQVVEIVDRQTSGG